MNLLSSSTSNNLITNLQVSDLANVIYSEDIKINSLLDDSVNWNYLNPVKNVLNYTFDIKKFKDPKQNSPVTEFNSAQKIAVQTILNDVYLITGIIFKPVTTNTEADIHFANTDLKGKFTAGLTNNTYNYQFIQSKNIVTAYNADSYVYLDNVEWNQENSAPTVGTRGYETLLHEIGHALGLKHPFENPNKLSKAQDNTDNTVMSYTHNGDYKSEFQSYDVAALKWIYGTDGLGGESNSSIILASQAKATSKNDVLIGTSKSEKIDGLAGNDTLDGGGGRDTLTGGDGNDLYIIDSIDDKVIETNLLDIDTIKSSVNYTLPKNIENLGLTHKAVTATGNELDNSIIGNVENNILKGMAGNDVLEGGKGNDRLTGGMGKDIFVFNITDYDFMGDFAPRAQNLDTINDFEKGIDLIRLSTAFIFKGFEVVNKVAKYTGDASLIYDTATRALYFDADGGQTRYTATAFVKFTGKINFDESDLLLMG